jgi:hypothetical protein
MGGSLGMGWPWERIMKKLILALMIAATVSADAFSYWHLRNGRQDQSGEVSQQTIYHLPEGRDHGTVANAGCLALNPSGKFTTVYVFEGDDRTHSIPVYLITKLTLVNSYPFE